MVVRQHRYRGLPFRRIESLASGETKLDEITSDYIGVIAARGRRADVARLFCDELERGGFGTWDEFVYPRALRADNGELLTELRRREFAVEELNATVAHYIPLPAHWDQYLAGLSSSRRQWLRRTLRQYENGQAPRRCCNARAMRRRARRRRESWSSSTSRGGSSAASRGRFRRRYSRNFTSG